MSQPFSHGISPPVTLALAALLSLAVMPHFAHLNVWVVGFFFVPAGLRMVSVYRPRVLPGRFLLLMLTLAAIANLFLNQPRLLSKDMPIGLLVAVVGLKLLELKNQRDLNVCVLLGFFTVITHFFYDQSMGMTAFLGLVVTGFTALLIHVNQTRPAATPYVPLHRAVVLLGQSIPVMVAMFYLFPRPGGPLWSLGFDHAAVSGLSDSLSPGSISRLSRSRAVAFRAEFKGEIPAAPRRYWRGPVLWHTDGREWTGAPPLSGITASYTAKGDRLSYSVTLEPSNRHWLFALDLPAKGPQNSTVLPDFQILLSSPVTKRLHYDLSSYLEYNTGPLSPEEKILGLQLPDNVTPRTRGLVARWKSESPDNASIVAAALSHFNREAFVYTLSPPLLGSHPVDQFLFETRRGFCAHFATSFTLLMRLAGIPARVVTGYQGGEINPHGDYLIVRQSDAHAWAEVWLEERGWVRVDPTAAVAPERVEHPIDLAASADNAPIQFQLGAQGPIGALIRQLRFGADWLHLSWHRWVLGYTDTRQMEMLSLLGLEFLKGSTLAVAMVAFTTVVVLVVTAGLWRNSRAKADPVLKCYRRFCRKLARRGLVRHEYEGPRDFAGRIIEQRPDLKTPVEQIIRTFVALRYGRSDSPSNRKLLRRLVQKFHP